MDPELLPGSGSGTRKIQSWFRIRIMNRSFRIHNTAAITQNRSFAFSLGASCWVCTNNTFFYVSFLIQLKKLQIKCTQKFRRTLFVLFFSKDKAFFGSDKNCSYRKLAWYKSRLCFLHDAGLPRWMRWKGRWWPWSPSSQRRRPSNTCVCYKGFNEIAVSMFCGPWLLAPTHPPPSPTVLENVVMPGSLF